MAIAHKIRISDGSEEWKNITPIKAIRYHCVECMGYQYSLIEGCTSPLCALYPYRMGSNPAIDGSQKRGKIPEGLAKFHENQQTQEGE